MKKLIDETEIETTTDEPKIPETKKDNSGVIIVIVIVVIIAICVFIYFNNKSKANENAN